MAGNGPNHDSLRASDTDRERIVEQLRRHAAEGRLTMDEFEERMSAAYEARTYGALSELTRDLPVDLSESRGGRGGQVPRPAVDYADPAAGTPLGVDLRGVGGRHDMHRMRNDLRRQMRDQARAQMRGQFGRGAAGRPGRGRQAVGLAALTASWATLSVLLTGIWLIAGFADHLHFGDFWPAWPIGIMGLLTLLKGIRFFGDQR